MISEARYADIRDLTKTGDLIEFRSPGFIGWCIRKRTGQNVNHTAGVFRLDNINRLSILESLERGPVPHLLSTRLKDFYAIGGVAYWVQLKPQYDEYRNDIAAAWFDSTTCDKRYDYWSIFMQMFRREEHVDMRRLFCSEMMYAGYIQAKLPMIPQKYVPRPGEFGATGCFNQSVKILV